MPDDADVVSEAAAAAEEVIFSRYGPTDVDDVDVTVSLTDGELTVDVYIDAGAETAAEREREEQVAEDAALAARQTVDRLFAAEE